MRAEIKELHQRLKTTTVYVTHDQVEAMTMADRIVVMRDGVVEQIGPARPLRPAGDPIVAGFLGSPAMNFLKGSIQINGNPTFLIEAGVELALASAPPAVDGKPSLRHSAGTPPPRRRRAKDEVSVLNRPARKRRWLASSATRPSPACFANGSPHARGTSCPCPRISTPFTCSDAESGRPELSEWERVMRFELMLPHQIRARSKPAGLVPPLRVLEFHGEHMAVGMDTLAVTNVLGPLEKEMNFVILPPSITAPRATRSSRRNGPAP